MTNDFFLSDLEAVRQGNYKVERNVGLKTIEHLIELGDLDGCHGSWSWLVLALRLATERNLRDRPAHVDIYFAEKRNHSSNPLFHKACRGENNLIETRKSPSRLLH